MPTPRHLEQDVRMYLSRALNRSLAPPDWLSINLTLRCNLRCSMCTTCYDVPDELSTGEILDVIDQAALWGVRVLNPLGGEPFVRTDLEQILQHAAGKDFHITLTTNGTLLTPARAARLARIPPEKLHLTFSLDGHEAAHDAIRGAGTWRRALAGYRAVRRADAEAKNPRRKVLANTLIHARDLAELPAFLDHLAEEGFDGVQLLNLFRRTPEAGAGLDPAERARREAEVAELWIGPERLPELERLVEGLLERLRHPPWPFFRIQSSEQDLRLIPAYYRDEVAPLEAPCWAGWKELYINADGSAIMCDGQLDFLNGRYGSVREQTLQQLWRSPALAARRRVVKSCRTPCIQNCYLRRDSDHLAPLAGKALGLAAENLRARMPRPQRAATPRLALPEGALTLELTDTCDCRWAGCPTPPERMKGLLSQAPGPLEAAWADPHTWQVWRDRHYVDFGRGFMGFELVKRVVEDLGAAGASFGSLALRWRGEPLLHPELNPILRFLLQVVGPGRLFGRLVLHTSALMLGEDAVDLLLARPEAPQEIQLDLDRMGAHQRVAWAHVERLAWERGSTLRFVLLREVPPAGLDPEVVSADLELWRHRMRDPVLVAGRLPPGGDAYWLRRADPRTFLGDQAAEAALREVAEALGAPQDLPDATQPRRCRGPMETPVISWDGKVTLCPWDTGLENQVGEVTSGRLSEIWNSTRLQDLRRDVASRGVPGLTPCRDCHQVFSPNG
ncbi:MAG: radical SAM/SPASM domain-containing protein [Pseudomonadota bacterium]